MADYSVSEAEADRAEGFQPKCGSDLNIPMAARPKWNGPPAE